MKRRRFLTASASAFAAAGIVQSPARAAEFVYKIAVDTQQGHPMTTRTQEAAANTLRDSGGRLEIRVFLNGALGGQGQTLPMLRSGALEMATQFDAATEAIVPEAGISSIPFAFATHQDAWTAMDGALGARIRAAVGKLGVYAFEKWWDVGFRQIENVARPVQAPADLRGMKLRVSASPVPIALFKALGATPTEVTGAEMYVAVQTRLIDGFDLPLISVQSRKMYEVTKYASITNHMWTGYTILVNGDAWRRLPKDLQQICESNFNQAAMRLRDDIVKLDDSLRSDLTSHGLAFNDADRPALKKVVQEAGLYKQWRDHYGAATWALLEKATGPLQ